MLCEVKYIAERSPSSTNLGRTMNTDNPIQDASKRSMLHILVPILLAVAGLVLMTYMIYAEGELGGIPILLIVAGVGWYLVARARVQSYHK
jgi:hypothetical protein